MTPTAPKQRQLLSLLLLRANRFVPVADCVEELWGDRPPRSAVATVQTYVMKLRTVFAGMGSLAESDRHRLGTMDRGYLLVVRPGELDADLFDDRVRQADLLLDGGDESGGARMLRDALALWRGPALADVAAGPLLRVRLADLEERRLSVLQARVDVDLRRGAHHGLVAELGELTRSYPLHEALHGQFMLALYRVDRAAEALLVFDRLRRRLVHELGLAPSTPLRQLRDAIVAADPGLEDPTFPRLAEGTAGYPGSVAGR